MPAVWGGIDDEGDGKPDPDDFGYEDTELFDVVQSWVLRRTNIRPLSNVPLVDLRNLRPYSVTQGFEVHVDAMRRLPNEKLQAPLVCKCMLVTAALPIGMQLDLSKIKGKEKRKKEPEVTLSYDDLFVAGGLNMESAVTAPNWKDARGKKAGAVEGTAALLVAVHTCSAPASGGTTTSKILAWAVLPLFLPSDSAGADAGGSERLFLNAGRFQLPLFSAAKTLSDALVTGFADRKHIKDATAAEGLKAATKRKAVLPLDGASVFVRVVDLQLRPELRPTPKSTVDLTQLNVGPSKKGYTAPVAAVRPPLFVPRYSSSTGLVCVRVGLTYVCCVCGQNRAKVTFASTKPKKEDQETFDDRFAELLAQGAGSLEKGAA